MGIIIGGILGFKFGSYFGMIMGAWLGAWVERQISGPRASGKQQATQESFFNALFLSMGKLAKADGQVSNLEIQKAEGIMSHMKLNAELRQRAIDLFNQGKSGGSIDTPLRVFAQLSRRSLSLRQIFLEMLVDVAEADGNISAAEARLIENICQTIGYPHHLLMAMMKMRGAAYGYDPHGGRQRQHHYQQNKQRQRQRPVSSSAPMNPYAVLGVDQDDSKATIRRAYKKMMSQHHPDKLIAKGLPPEMMKVAEEKAKQVQQSWEKVKDLKGW
ncbi:co-chaperone DjlA [Marinicella rhabdoformis]|uniref:co-chaperone DjlA n=1 Tax=Marinicella rhabdoformis TaxID=2580566 RepID=UPI0012AEDE25|nr:co-chaperone DjlA [Marinicella rhabdoformis]